jgi:hypothetical protein
MYAITCTADAYSQVLALLLQGAHLGELVAPHAAKEWALFVKEILF